VTTVTVQIVTLLVGDQEFDSPKTLAAFALGLVLFVFTLILNFIALRVVRNTVNNMNNEISRRLPDARTNDCSTTWSAAARPTNC
jgi:hypothetical protein